MGNVKIIVAFSEAYSGLFKMITVAMVFFAFTTLLGNCFYCDNLLIYIHKKQPEKAFMKGFRLVSALALFLGVGMEMSLLWDLSDALMGLWHSLTFRLS